MLTTRVPTLKTTKTRQQRRKTMMSARLGLRLGAFSSPAAIAARSFPKSVSIRSVGKVGPLVLTLRQSSTTSAGGGILGWPKRNPFTFQVIFATIKTSIADIIVQMGVDGKSWDEIDWKRNLVFVAFGGLYLGGFQWFIYVTCFRRMFPAMDKFANQTLREKMANKAGLRALGGQVVFDNFVHYTFIYFPVFYVFKQSIQGDNEFNLADCISDGLAKYKKNFWEDNYAIWALWIPCDIVIYAIPIWMRLPANHMISLVWTCILSYIRGGKIEESEDTLATSTN